MSDEPQGRSSRAGVILVALAVGGSAVGVVAWHLISNRNAGLDTSGFDMASAPDPSKSQAPPFFAPAAPSGSARPAPVLQNSLGMVKGDANMQAMGQGAAAPSKPAAGTNGGGKPANAKEEAALSFKDAAIRNEKYVDGFIRRMQAKHPSLTQYGKDWVASPELRALRDQYWKEKDPLKFAYGLAKSNDFGKLIRKYGADPGVRDTLMSGMKEAPPGMMAAVGGVFQSDNIVKDLVNTVAKAAGLPPSLVSMLDGSSDKAPDQSKVMADIMGSADMKKAMQNPPAGAVPLDPNAADKAKDIPNNGFRPLGGR